MQLDAQQVTVMLPVRDLVRAREFYERALALPSGEEKLLQMVRDSIDAGGKGVSIGRNIFQHRNVIGITKAVSGIVLEDMEVEEAMQLLK